MAVNIVRKTTSKGEPRWHLRYRAGRYDPTVHLGAFTLEKAAKAAKLRAEQAVAEGQVPTKEMLVPTPTVALSVADELDAWLDTRLDLDWKTVANHRQTARRVRERWPNRSAASLTRADLQRWVQDLHDRGYAPGTIRRMLNTLSGFWRDQEREPNPARGLRRPKVKPQSASERMPDPATVTALRQAAPQLTPLLDLLEHGGLRISEAVHVTWADVDATPRPEQGAPRGRILVRGTKTAGEARADRWVAVLDEQPDWLPRRPEGAGDSERVAGFPNVKANDHARTALSEALDDAGLPRFTPHGLRHLHASRILHHNWLPPALAKDRLGHSLAVYLNTYAHALPPD